MDTPWCVCLCREVTESGPEMIVVLSQDAPLSFEARCDALYADNDKKLKRLPNVCDHWPAVCGNVVADRSVSPQLPSIMPFEIL